MFLHLLKYELLTGLRNRQAMFWMLAFPIILGTFFNIAFSGLYESDELFKEIPVAVCTEQENATFSEVMDSLSEGGDALFAPEYLAENKAMKKLENGDVSGVIFVNGSDIRLSVKSESTAASIIRSFLDNYEVNVKVITDAANADPQKLGQVIEAMSAEISPVEARQMSGDSADPYVQYFYNLLAMNCLFGALSGLGLVISVQANLSELGARKSVSPVHKLESVTAALTAAGILNLICSGGTLLYLTLALKVDFGAPLPALFGVTAVAVLASASMGFFIGAIGKMSEGMKIGILISLSMFFCFLSGLCVGNMYALVERYAPWFNRINPAALISNSFLALNIYGGSGRLTANLLTLGGYAVFFTLGGYYLTRRRRYASL